MRCAGSVTGIDLFNLFDASKYTRWVTLVVSSPSKLPYSLHELPMQVRGGGRSDARGVRECPSNGSRA
jgi:hypothetical protein